MELASVPASTAARPIDSGRKPWKVPNYWPYAVPLSGQGQVVSATLIAAIGSECSGECWADESRPLLLVFREKEVVRDVESIQAQRHYRGSIGGW
jgi:hypothetical protein